MATKSVELPEIGTITMNKRRGARHIRLSVSPEGQIRLSLPPWVPYATGIAFAKQKSEWLKSQVKPPIVLRHGMRVGKAHILDFSAGKTDKVTSRVTSGTINIKVPT